MNVPNAQFAVVPVDKITGYLLNSGRADGYGKAKFFESIGFTVENWPSLSAAFLQIVQTDPVVNRIETSHGEKYIVDGLLTTPCGRMPRVRTVWIIDAGGSIPRLVTAYPHAGGD